MQNIGTATNKNMNLTKINKCISDNMISEEQSSKRKESNISMSNSSSKQGIQFYSSSSSSDSDNENKEINPMKFIKFQQKSQFSKRTFTGRKEEKIDI